MAILGTLMKRGLELRKTITKVRRTPTASQMQRKTLIKLLSKAKFTQFGEAHEFEAILASKNPENVFRKIVPVSDYDKIYRDWWHKMLEDQQDVCWPGKVKYFALSSGTSGAPSKKIPVTNSMIRSMRKTGIMQVLTLVNYDLPEEIFTKGVLVVGGSSDLVNMGNYYQGDLSGINQAKMPFYTQPFYKPGKEIAKQRDWGIKIDDIVKNAPNWDIAIITGVPAWNQLIIERIVEHYKLRNIHELWPNLSVFIYGGVAIEPYLKGFNQLMGRPVHYLETYLASEGFIAYQSRKDVKGMQLVLNNGIFMEFIRFSPQNFHPDGSLRENPEVLLIDQVEEGVEYALLISTNAGAWRYLIGDVVRFTSVALNEIVITGRTKHFLSLCGEHLSTDNMNHAIRLVSEHFNISIKEYTVAGISSGNLFGHKWYISSDDCAVSNEVLRDKLDAYLRELNDDYAVERNHALKEIIVEIIPTQVFYDWMDARGKMGAQNKFPRVQQKEQFAEWEQFVSQKLASRG